MSGDYPIMFFKGNMLDCSSMLCPMKPASPDP